ncbi:hypothetical protein ACVIHC_002222 [Bradyrhizobium diazoefficiens]
MDIDTTRDADAAEMAALYRAADDLGREFAAYMERGMAIWARLVEARKARDTFKSAYKAKYQLSGN